MAMDGTMIAVAQNKGGIMAQSNTASNVREFPKTETISKLDEFLIRNGAKQMATPKTDTAQTPIEWNKSVLGLTATLIAILGVLVGFVWNYAVLSTKFELQQQRMDRFESDQKDLKNEINRFKEFQLKTDAYKLGAAENHSEKEKK